MVCMGHFPLMFSLLLTQSKRCDRNVVTFFHLMFHIDFFFSSSFHSLFHTIVAVATKQLFTPVNFIFCTFSSHKLLSYTRYSCLEDLHNIAIFQKPSFSCSLSISFSLLVQSNECFWTFTSLKIFAHTHARTILVWFSFCCATLCCIWSNENSIQRKKKGQTKKVKQIKINRKRVFSSNKSY